VLYLILKVKNRNPIENGKAKKTTFLTYFIKLLDPVDDLLHDNMLLINYLPVIGKMVPYFYTRKGYFFKICVLTLNHSNQTDKHEKIITGFSN
jgi:hypothetical protein